MRFHTTILTASLALAAFTGAALADTPGADWMSRDAVTQKLVAAGYDNITGLEADDGHWEGKATKNGQIMEIDADPRTGAVIKEEIDD